VAKGLTKRQAAVLTAIIRQRRERGYAPSVRELAREVGISSATAQGHLKALVAKGYLRSTGEAFGLEVLVTPPNETVAEEVLQIPVEGRVAAGRPIEAIALGEQFVDIPAQWLRAGHAYYALRVQGVSMRDDLIDDGDIVIVQRDAEIRKGDKAVCLLEDGSATLKRVYRERGRWRLQPANPDFEPIYARNVVFQGRVVAIYRREE
jgi:repressor LexA